MKIKLEIDRSTLIPVPRAQADVLLADLEATFKRFPKLKKLTKLADSDYRWDMQTIGSKVAKIAHEVTYGARYTTDKAKGQIAWKPLPKVGNAQVEGFLQLKDEGGKTRLTFHVKGELDEVPVPLMYRLIAPAFIQGKFTALIDAFLERTATALSGTAANHAAA